MVKILQYGQGNFLRAFVDVYFDTLNKTETGGYVVNIIKSTPSGSIESFEKQNNKYHVVLRGTENGQTVENVCKVECVENVINPFIDYDKYIALAKDSGLKIIISNTTEAGICYNAENKIDDFAGLTYPAKLTKFLYARFNAGLDGVYILPVELIDNNANELKKCVDNYIALWGLPDAFKKWNDEQNFYCNTLVDRIVSGYPRDEETKAKVETLIGGKDELIAIGEPFGLWAIENKGRIADYIKAGIHNIEVVLTNNIAYYKKRKVRVLNGSHTNLVPTALMLGAVTVYDCMVDEKLSAFMENTLKNEIIPYVSIDIKATTAFADSVKDRFMNPFLNHQLVSIALNSVSKWKARVLPSFKDYYANQGKIAPYLTIGFSYLMALYSSVERQDGKYLVKVPNRTIELKDDAPYLEYFANGNNVAGFMSNVEIWGEDLTEYKDFAKVVEENVVKIKKGICLI